MLSIQIRDTSSLTGLVGSWGRPQFFCGTNRQLPDRPAGDFKKHSVHSVARPDDRPALFQEFVDYPSRGGRLPEYADSNPDRLENVLPTISWTLILVRAVRV